MLILLTDGYPARSGSDTVFILNEIGALSERFDRVAVLSTYAFPGEEREELPTNVTYEGSILRSPRAFDLALALMDPRVLLGALGSLYSEMRARGVKVRFLRLLRATIISEVGSLRVRKILRTSANTKPVIYAFWGAASGYTIAAKSLRKYGLALRLHGYDLYEERNGYLPLRKQLYSRSDVIMPVSEDGARYLIEKQHLSRLRGKISVARLGTEDHGVGPTPSDTGLVRVVSCSGIVPLKRVNLIHQVVGLLAQQRSVEWVHFGGGELYEQLRFDIEAFQGKGLSVDLRGTTDHSEILSYYRENAVHVFVNLSEAEGIPVSIMEAMSFGIPVLATDVGGTREIVGDQLGSGVLVRSDATVTEVAGHMTRLLNERKVFQPRAVWKDRCSARANSHAVAKQLFRLCSVDEHSSLL